MADSRVASTRLAETEWTKVDIAAAARGESLARYMRRAVMEAAQADIAMLRRRRQVERR